MHRKPSKFQQEPFDLRPSAALDHEYNALTDPHANYYFVSFAAKQRLKELKRELRRDKHKKSHDEKEMLKQIKEKIKFKFPKIQLPLVNQKELSAIIASGRQHSENGLPKRMEWRIGSSIGKQEWTAESGPGQEDRERMQTDGKKSFSCNKGDRLRKSINHSDFLQFLAQKKSSLLESDVL